VLKLGGQTAPRTGWKSDFKVKDKLLKSKQEKLKRKENNPRIRPRRVSSKKQGQV
jgi:hypothetical protein